MLKLQTCETETKLQTCAGGTKLQLCPEGCPETCADCADTYNWSLSSAVSALIPTSGSVSRSASSDDCVWTYTEDSFENGGSTYYYEVLLSCGGPCGAGIWSLTINLYVDVSGTWFPWGTWLFCHAALGAGDCPAGTYAESGGGEDQTAEVSTP
jgi:hypothetical protein